MTVNLINRLKKDPEWAYIFIENKDEIRQMYSNAVDADYLWIDYLFEDNPILLGIGSSILKEYVDYNASIVMSSVGVEKLKEEVFNPCVWSNSYSKSSNVQTAMKEKNSANYLLGRLNTNIPNDFWENLP